MNKNYFIICVLLFFSTRNFAQWEPLDGPYGGSIWDMDRNDKYLFASTHDGLFRSTDGKSWIASRFVPGKHMTSGAFGVNDSIIVASSAEFFISFNNGDTWEEINRPTDKTVLDIVLTDFAIYVRTFDELWYSTDFGHSWQLSSFPIDSSSIFYISTENQRILIGSTGKIYLSSPTADQWISVPVNFPDLQIHKIYVEDTLWFVFDPYREVLLRSSDSGLHWTENVDGRWDAIYIQMGKLQDVFFISLDTLIVKSTDGGITWTNCESQGYATASGMITTDSSLLFGTFYRGVLRSDDFGDSCYSSTQVITASGINHIAIHEQSVLAASNYNGIFDFNPSNSVWDDQYDIEWFDSYFNDMLSLDGNLYTSRDSKDVYRFNDATQSWDLISDSTFLYAGQMYRYQDTLLVSSFGLKMWHPETPLWKEFTIYFDGDTIKPTAFAYNANYIFTGHEHQVFRKSIGSGIWTRILSTDTFANLTFYQVRNVYSMGDKLFITMVVNNDSQDYRILMSEDQGITWNYVDEDFPNLHFPWWSGLGEMKEVNSFILVNGYRYNLGVVVSELNHISWQSFNEGLPNLGVQDLAFDDEYIYAALRSNGVWRRKLSDLTTTNLKPDAFNNSLQCYPNPASNYFEVTSIPSDVVYKNIYICDITGRIMEIKRISHSDHKFDVSTLTNGLYFVVLPGDGRLYVQKLIIQH